MKKSALVFITILIALLSQNATAQTNNFYIEKFDSLSAEGHFSGVVCISEKQNPVFQSAYGFAVNETKTENTLQHSFELASISKLFTAISILQLNERNKLSINDSVIKYFPEFPYPSITIRHLLSHTSGMKDLEMFMPIIKKNPDTLLGNSNIIPTLIALNVPLSSNPGEKWKYNNIGYNILALIIEKISGYPYSQFVMANIIEPAQMKNTCIKSSTGKCNHISIPNYYRYNTLYDSQKTNVDLLVKSNFQMRIFKKCFSDFYGSDNFFSTTTDLLLLDKAFTQNKLLNKESMALMYSPVSLNNGQLINISKNKIPNTHFGLGWFLTEVDGIGKLAWHDGTNPGCETIYLKAIEENQTIILLSNNEDEGTQQLGFSLLKKLNNQETTFPTYSLTQLLGQIMNNKGINEVLKTFSTLKNQTSKYHYEESSLNDLGYQFIKVKKIKEAVAVFKVVTDEYPNSSNAFDSYGEALALSGERQSAIAAYEKSLSLDANNENARKQIEALKKSK